MALVDKNLNPKFTGYGKKLHRVVDPDQADAAQAVAYGLQQIKEVFNSTPQQLATVGNTLETTKGLDLIEGLTAPLPTDVIDFYKDTFGTGTGARNEFLLTDVIGTVAGYGITTELEGVVSAIQAMETVGAFTELTGTYGVYTTMNKVLSGDFDVVEEVAAVGSISGGGGGVDPDPAYPQYKVKIVIPSPYKCPATYEEVQVHEIQLNGLAGGGQSTDPFSPDFTAVREEAMSCLISKAGEVIQDIATAYPVQAALSNRAHENIEAQLQRDLDNQAKAALDLTATPKNTKTPVIRLANGLHQSGLDDSLGGESFILEQMADRTTQSGQAIIAAMREGRNIRRLQDAGIPTNDLFLNTTFRTPEKAPLETSTFSVQEARDKRTT